jgi:hypothetical protein
MPNTPLASLGEKGSLKKTGSGILFMLLLIAMLTFALDIRPASGRALAVPPLISSISQVPDISNVNDSEAVTVSANVTDNSGTGIVNVTIVYSPDGWTINTTAAMTLNSTTGLYDGTIPGFLAGTVVYYVIQAYDNNGGLTESRRATYTVVSRAQAVLVTEITPNTAWVYQGQVVNVNVTVRNIGGFGENVWVTLLYNLTAELFIGAYILPVFLDMGQSYTFPFTWNTTGMPINYPGYTLTAMAFIIGGSNTLSDVNITVRLIGDVNGDGRIDLRDIALVARAFGSTPTSPNWNPAADINGDGKIDLKDIALVARNFGQRS